MVDAAPTRELILTNLGTPSAPTESAVRAFLAEFLSDPMVVERPRWLWLPILHGIVLRRRPARVAALYRTIWTDAGSPLAVESERLLDAVRADLGDQGSASLAYRYGAQSLEAAMAAAAARAERLVVAPLFPQRTASSAGTVEATAHAIARRLGLEERLSVAHLDPADPGYVVALADRLRTAVQEAGDAEPEHLVFSFHAIPAAVDRREGGRYQADCRRTAEALTAAVAWKEERTTVCFQSRFGRTPWLGPATAATLADLAARGVKRVAVSAPGFLTDGLETLEELSRRGRETFLAAGGESFVLARAPAGHPALAHALAALSA